MSIPGDEICARLMPQTCSCGKSKPLTKQKNNETTAYFTPALVVKRKNDAAYQPAPIAFEEYKNTKKSHLLLKSENYLRDGLPHFSKDIKLLTEKLYEGLRVLLNA